MALKIHLALFHFLAQSPQLHSIWHLCLHGNHHKHNVWLHARWKLATAEGEASWLLWALHSKPAGVWKKEREAKKETWMWVGQVPPLPDLPLFFLRPPGIFLRGLEKAPAAFVLQLVVLSCGTCSRRDLPEVSDPAWCFLGTQEGGDRVMMAILPVETYLSNWGFFTLLWLEIWSGVWTYPYMRGLWGGVIIVGDWHW